MTVLENSLRQSHDYVKRVLREGDIAVDATAGNGNDTLMLASIIGDTGKVYSFDIQKAALDNTEKKLRGCGMLERVMLINDGHQNMDIYVGKGIKAVTFNLGYLPGGDHSISTTADTTIEAIEKAMTLIADDGIITVVVYYGGDSGFEEKNTLIKYIETIDSKKFTVMKTRFVNQLNCPPILVCIEKNV